MVTQLVSSSQAYYEREVVPPIDTIADRLRVYPLVSIATGGIRATAHIELLIHDIASAFFQEIQALTEQSGIFSEVNLEKANENHALALQALEKAAQEIAIIFFSLLDMIPLYGCLSDSYPTKNEIVPAEFPKEILTELTTVSNQIETLKQELAQPSCETPDPELEKLKEEIAKKAKILEEQNNAIKSPAEIPQRDTGSITLQKARKRVQDKKIQDKKIQDKKIQDEKDLASPKKPLRRIITRSQKK